MFITPAEIRELSSFSEVEALTDGQIQGYIERADSWIRRATNRDYSGVDDAVIRQDMRVATLLLVEYIWLWDNPEVKESMMGPDQGVKLGSYSVQYKNINTWKNALPGEETGIKELDNILKNYQYVPAASLFTVLKKG